MVLIPPPKKTGVPILASDTLLDEAENSLNCSTYGEQL